MTMMEFRLIRLHGTEDWETWGDDWPKHVDVVGNLYLVHGWHGPRVQLQNTHSPGG
jgi:hypothetical protein